MTVTFSRQSFHQNLSVIIPPSLPSLDFTIPNRQTHKLIRYGPYKKMDLSKFKSDLKDSELITNPKNNVTDLYNQYHSVLSDLVDHHAPLTTRTCSTRPRDPWITSEALDAKRRKR